MATELIQFVHACNRLYVAGGTNDRDRIRIANHDYDNAWRCLLDAGYLPASDEVDAAFEEVRQTGNLYGVAQEGIYS